MTAFNNIKTNNWPAASNDLEDFLVLELPLNDQAALTSSRRDIVAGRTVLHPKRTLTNTGASMVAAVATGVDYGATGFTKSSNWRTDYAQPEIGLFNGDGTATQAAVAGNNAEHWYAFPTPLTNVTKVETRMGHDGNQSARAHMGNGTTGYVSSTGSGVYFTVYSGAATTFSKIGWRSNNGSGASIYDIRVTDDTGSYVLTSTVPNKKHYDDNADFGSTSEDKYLTVPASPDFSFGNDPWCIECWAYIRSTPGDGTAIWDFDTSVGYTNEEWICGYLGSGLVYFYWGSSSNYHGISTSYTANQWQHWAWTWDGTTARLFKDGTLAASSTTTNKSAGWGSATRDITIGKQNLGSRFGDQVIQDLRFYKGVAKYTANFTPPGAILG